MVTNRRMHWAAGSTFALAAFVALTGCATKGYVQKEVAGVRGYADTQVTAVRGDVDRVRTLAERLASGEVQYTEVALHQVQFDFDDFRLGTEAQTILDQAGSQVMSNPRYVVEIRGFADATGSDRYNYMLGRERADEVVRFLMTRHSVPMGRIATASFGEETPIADNESEEGRSQNRRVQVRVIEIKHGGEPVAGTP